MNSALKPALLQPGFPQAAGQSSPAKGNVATANHAVALPQGAQNTLHHGFNNLVGQDLVQHVIAPLPPLHAAPSMAPVSANKAQMAQNMSHHGNLSHVTLNSVTHVNIAARPSKSATTTSATLSFVQESKATTSQPLALTRIPEKKEPDSTGSANGTVESPESESGTPVTLKLQNPEPKQKKQDIAITLSSTPKPPEKPVSTPSTPQKPKLSNPVIQSDVTVQSQVATANEPPEKSPAKPINLKLALSANVAPTRSDSKPLPELANENLSQEKPSTPQKEAESENAKVEPTKEEEKVEVVEKLVPIIENIEMKPETKELEVSKKLVVEIVENVENKIKTPFKAEVTASKSTLKLAIVTPAIRKRTQVFENEPTLAKNTVEGDSNSDIRRKRNRTQVQLYQSPTPEIAISAKLSASAGCSTPTKQNDDKHIVFYKNEYLAVRNAEGGFYVCQAVQNVYRTTRRIKIRWLSQDKSDSTGETYKPDFYDVTDMECVLTTLSLSRASGGAQLLRTAERERAQSILQRALRAERGDNCLSLTEEHPDGLDLSLYTDESQLEKKSRKRNGSKGSPSDASETAKEEATPIKKARTMPKRSPKSVRKAKSAPKTQKRKSLGSTPSVATSSKTATARSEKGKKTPLKQAKIETPVMTPSGRRLFKENKASSIVSEPSTSKGKTGRTRRIIK